MCGATTDSKYNCTLDNKKSSKHMVIELTPSPDVSEQSEDENVLFCRK
jgi:hypothetical protein